MEKTYICRNWEPRNEYTRPIREIPEYRNSGIIKAVTPDQDKIQIGRITYETFQNEEFQYIITPFWEIIDTLPPSVFQGIPGIDMDLRLEHYYRVNYVPVFMTERTPGPNREDLWELLDSVNLTYYDRLEWLIRTDLRAAVDNLIVERARDVPRKSQAEKRQELEHILEESQYGDEIMIANIRVLGKNSEECTKMLNRLMHYGIHLLTREEKLDLSVEAYSAFLPLVSAMYQMDRERRQKQQRQGISRAKEKGVYQGRKRKPVDEAMLKDTIIRFQQKEIPLEEALRLTGLSKSTFYRRIREQKENNGSNSKNT